MHLVKASEAALRLQEVCEGVSSTTDKSPLRRRMGAMETAGHFCTVYNVGKDCREGAVECVDAVLTAGVETILGTTIGDDVKDCVLSGFSKCESESPRRWSITEDGQKNCEKQ
uniref:Uncharacterized protein n=1 Tax=Haptolina brevifila TaxID=156173 RepID=A0A7S2FYN8_9EUKA